MAKNKFALAETKISAPKTPSVKAMQAPKVKVIPGMDHFQMHDDVRTLMDHAALRQNPERLSRALMTLRGAAKMHRMPKVGRGRKGR